MQSTGDAAERQAAHKEIWESQAENVWVIGTVAAAPVPFVTTWELPSSRRFWRPGSRATMPRRSRSGFGRG